MLPHADSEDTGQIGHFVGFVVQRLIYNIYNKRTLCVENTSNTSHSKTCNFNFCTVKILSIWIETLGQTVVYSGTDKGGI